MGGRPAVGRRTYGLTEIPSRNARVRRTLFRRRPYNFHVFRAGSGLRMTPGALLGLIRQRGWILQTGFPRLVFAFQSPARIAGPGGL